MSIDQIKAALPEQAKDIKLNLATILTTEGAPDLTKSQIAGIALASAYATKHAWLIENLLAAVQADLTEVEISAAKSAAIIMAMNNIYYRFVHLVSDKSFASMPARLRMNIISNPGISKVDFELNCLAVSAINGCGLCIDAHTNELLHANVTQLAIQSVIRIAAVLNATAMGLD